MESTEETNIFVETWFEASWTDHMRHHDRVSGEDRKLQDRIKSLLTQSAGPVVKHYLASKETG